ncbi:MAG: aromatic amino acid lyase, partial [Alteromonadaceae bacterium]|nr:aromatic amino acid lyase [Alteromonadaceae bacterium]
MDNESDVVIISNEDLTIEQLVLVATSQAKLKLSEEIKQKVIDGRKIVDKIIEEEQIVYGITTGVGENSKIRISSEDSIQLQKNLIMSHACGVGEPLEKVQVRAVMVMMVKNLSFGYSGICLETVEMLVELLNKDITPYVPKEGSLGYLIYQSHISLVLLGMGEAYYKGSLLKGEEVLEEAGVQSIELHEKEGLSLINGSVDMTALAALAIYNSINLLKNA